MEDRHSCQIYNTHFLNKYFTYSDREITAAPDPEVKQHILVQMIQHNFVGRGCCFNQ